MNILSAISFLVIFLEASLVPLGAAIAVFSGVGAGIGMGIATGKAVEAIARQPEAAGKIRTSLIMGLAFAETTAIYGVFIAIVLIFVA